MFTNEIHLDTKLDKEVFDTVSKTLNELHFSEEDKIYFFEILIESYNYLRYNDDYIIQVFDTINEIFISNLNIDFKERNITKLYNHVSYFLNYLLIRLSSNGVDYYILKNIQKDHLVIYKSKMNDIVKKQIKQDIIDLVKESEDYKIVILSLDAEEYLLEKIEKNLNTLIDSNKLLKNTFHFCYKVKKKILDKKDIYHYLAEFDISKYTFDHIEVDTNDDVLVEENNKYFIQYLKSINNILHNLNLPLTNEIFFGIGTLTKNMYVIYFTYEEIYSDIY